MDYPRILICIAIMAIVTYLARMLPLAIFKKRIQNQFIKSFLAYVPYAVLAAMAFPEIFYSTANLTCAIVGTVTALALAYFGRSLLTVALGATFMAYITQVIMNWL